MASQLLRICGNLIMKREIKGSDIRRFRVASPTRIEIDLSAPIDPAYFDLHIDLQITGASGTMAAAAGGDSRKILDCKPLLET